MQPPGPAHSQVSGRTWALPEQGGAPSPPATLPAHSQVGGQLSRERAFPEQGVRHPYGQLDVAEGAVSLCGLPPPSTASSSPAASSSSSSSLMLTHNRVLLIHLCHRAVVIAAAAVVGHGVKQLRRASGKGGRG